MNDASHDGGDREPRPALAVIVPTLDEERHIRACLESLLPQVDAARDEVLVVDGGSRDATRSIVAEIAARHPSVRLIDNPKRIQAAAVNLAARLAAPGIRVIVRADAHALYPADFVARCVAALRESGAASAVVPMRTVGRHGFQRAVAAVQDSLLGNGGAAHRRGGPSAFVDHGHHAAFDREVFLAVGGYDESFTHNEDAELDHRLRQAGHRIWMCRAATITYFPRERASALARQYYNHGRGRGRTLMRHRIRPRLRQMLPPAATLGSIGGLALATVEPAALVLPGTYLAICHLYAVGLAARRRDAWLLAGGLVATIMHVSWTMGLLRSVAVGLRTRPEPQGAAMVASRRNGVRTGI